MKTIKVKITKFINTHQPGFVECTFFDINNVKHIVHEKVPVVTEEFIDENSEYPQSGLIACQIISKYININREIVYNISIKSPWDIETIDGLTEFEVFENQLFSQ